VHVFGFIIRNVTLEANLFSFLLIEPQEFPLATGQSAEFRQYKNLRVNIYFNFLC
jgi:hypothetical protein